MRVLKHVLGIYSCMHVYAFIKLYAYSKVTVIFFIFRLVISPPSNYRLTLIVISGVIWPRVVVIKICHWRRLYRSLGVEYQ